MSLALDAAALTRFLDEAFPGSSEAGRGRIVITDGTLTRMALTPAASMLRPGGIVSGPTLMTLTDTIAYAAILSRIGPVAMAVTSTLSIAFLRACRHETVNADARFLKLGRRLAVLDVRCWQESPDAPVTQASVTYALPA